jgi:hypothetical protein
MKQFLDRYPNRIPEIYGTFIAVGLIGYFLISYWVGFVHIVELRLLNFPILVTGVYFALKQFEHTHEGDLNYFRGLVTGIATAAIGTLTFVLFLYGIFMIDRDLFQSVVKEGPMGTYQNTYLATFAVAIEGIFSGFMATFILMNFIDTAKT